MIELKSGIPLLVMFRKLSPAPMNLLTVFFINEIFSMDINGYIFDVLRRNLSFSRFDEECKAVAKVYKKRITLLRVIVVI